MRYNVVALVAEGSLSKSSSLIDTNRFFRQREFFEDLNEVSLRILEYECHFQDVKPDLVVSYGKNIISLGQHIS